MVEEKPQIDTTNVNVLKEHWSEFDHQTRIQYFYSLPRHEAEDLFLSFSPEEQVEMIGKLQPAEKRSWIRLLPLDDVADFLQRLGQDQRTEVLFLLDDQTRREVMGLLAYAEDDAGGLMNPRYIRLRPEMTVEEAIRYLRAQARTPVETIYYAYVLESDQKLVGVVSFRGLLLSLPEKTVREIMRTEFVSVQEHMDREDLSRLFSQHNLMAIPVLDSESRMKGIVTYDDIVTVVQKEATEDIQKLGGMEALDAPYLNISFMQMVKKRGGWLTALFLGEMFTATAMGHYQIEIERAVVLALFIPLIISSGGNTGSQASTLIIRSLALRELRLRDWWRVLGREVAVGLLLGGMLGLIGLLRIVIWEQWHPTYGDHYFLVALTVAFSLIGVVLWGTTAGAMLPFILRKIGFDPASASAPLVATLVDVTGLVIYFSVATILLRGALL